MTRLYASERQPIDSGPPRVIPVLDLKQERAVRAIGGRRDEYRPITSRLTRDGCPISLAKSYLALGHKSLYLADLDAIAGAAPNWALFEELMALGMELWIDAGVSSGASASALAARSINGRQICVVAGSESLLDVAPLKDMVHHVGADRFIFSLDLFQGRPLRRHSEVGGMEVLRQRAASAEPASPAEEQRFFHEALEIVEQAVAMGVRRLIVLDLARVGCGTGAGNLDLLRAVANRWPAVTLISGGGVRSRADLEEFAQAGCQAVLVGSALHDGSL